MSESTDQSHIEALSQSCWSQESSGIESDIRAVARGNDGATVVQLTQGTMVATKDNLNWVSVGTEGHIETSHDGENFTRHRP